MQGQGASALQRVLPPEMFLDLRMGSQAALLAMADAFPGHASVRRVELDRFRASVHEVPPVLVGMPAGLLTCRDISVSLLEAPGALVHACTLPAPLHWLAWPTCCAPSHAVRQGALPPHKGLRMQVIELSDNQRRAVNAALKSGAQLGPRPPTPGSPELQRGALTDDPKAPLLSGASNGHVLKPPLGVPIRTLARGLSEKGQVRCQGALPCQLDGGHMPMHVLSRIGQTGTDDAPWSRHVPAACAASSSRACSLNCSQQRMHVALVSGPGPTP